MTTSVHGTSFSSETKWPLALCSTVLFAVTWYALIVGGMILFGIGADPVGTGEVAGHPSMVGLRDVVSARNPSGG
jgi:hypothetical protein